MELDLFWWTCHKPRINWSDPNLYYCMAVIIFNPVFWNCVARLEYNKKVISRLIGSPNRGCMLLAATIVFLALVRSRRFQLAIGTQYKWELLESNLIWLIGGGLLAIGIILVISSFFALGFYGTYLGDYFGILMEEKVTSFPFNIVNDPMYVGSVLEHLGIALQSASPTGLLLTTILAIMYIIAMQFEGPFTAEIYAQKALEESKKNK
ncbi:phosphatidylethanolamine N-methyltransferase-like isoform X3 [Lytechinus variegatus]|nr:phosphatidylethanolamine N-methyltransferase-like isoform X3 [Lytechinus variegatus]